MEWCDLNPRGAPRIISQVEKQGRVVRPNSRPGLGISINEAEVKKHPFQQELPQQVFYRDGSVGDW